MGGGIKALSVLIGIGRAIRHRAGHHPIARGVIG
jgi:hypothetical protein